MPRRTLVSITPEQGQALHKMALRNKDLVDASPELQDLLNRVRAEVLNADDDVDLTNLAKEMYVTEDIEVDNWAAYSRTTVGVWVSAWVWVESHLLYHPDPNLDDEENPDE